MINDSVIIIGSAFLLDLIMGDPSYSYHPVRLIGKWISFVEKYFFKYRLTGIFSGIIFWCLAVGTVSLLYFVIYYLLDSLTFHFIAVGWQIFIVYSTFAFKDMMDHVKPIYAALKQNDLNLAREKVGYIVGRDIENLKSEAIVRATIESISESFVDAFLSPVFWYVLPIIIVSLLFPGFSPPSTFFGVMAMIIYRTANTLDSMVGYQSERYEKFGKFSARMDDVMNFIPARLSLFFLLPGVILSQTNTLSAIKIFFRDRLKSKSPNAAHAMCVFAGALEISLGGPSFYANEILNKPVIGDQKIDIKNEMIIKAAKIFIYSGFFVVVFTTAVCLFF